MVRIVAIVILVLAAWLLIMQAIRWLQGRAIDWNGIGFAAGFIALAVVLRLLTGWG